MRLLILMCLISGLSNAQIAADYFLKGKITYQLQAEFNIAVLKVKEEKKKNIVVIFNSNGGYLDVTNNIISFMQAFKKSGYTFECHLIRAGSGAASIFANCSKRIAYINSIWMQHKASLIGTGECIGNCVTEDFKRLEAEALLIGKNIKEYREFLPNGEEHLLTYLGKSLLLLGIASEYNEAFLQERKK